MKKTKLKFKNNIAKKLFFCFFVFLLFCFIAIPAYAESADLFGGGAVNNQAIDAGSLSATSGLADTDPRIIIATLIRTFLGLLGIIAVLIILWGGFKYMTAGGAEDRIADARKILTQGIIGLIITTGAFGIASFVINMLQDSVDGDIAIEDRSGDDGGFLLGGRSAGEAPGIGETCFTSSLDAACSAGECSDGLICDTNCVCQESALPTEGENCDNDTETEACEVGECASGLVCSDACVCEAQPKIAWVTPAGGFCDNDNNQFCASDADCAAGECNQSSPNGASGNFITIGGINFGDEPGQVFFNAGKASGEDDWVEAVLASDETFGNPSCATAWTDKQIIVIVPQDATTSPIRVVATSTRADTTDDDNGEVLNDFVFNTIERPGLCLLENTNSQRCLNNDCARGLQDDTINYFGANLENGEGFFGIPENRIRTTSSFAFNDSGSVQVPNIEEGLVSTFVLNPSGVASNYLSFTKDIEPYQGPQITSFDPIEGAPGQYVTIHGTDFGSSKRTSQVYFGNTEADYEFPQICADSVWRDNQIIVKVPAELADGGYNIRLTIGNWDIDTSSLNPGQFTASSTMELAPSLCRISPALSQPNTPIELWGEYFGDKSTGKVRFQLNNDQSGENIVFWGQDPEAQEGIKPDKVETKIHQEAGTGPVRVVQNNVLSNSLNLEIGICANNSACASQEVCCPVGSFKGGSCIPGQINECYANIQASVYEWTFSSTFGRIGSPCSSDQNSCVPDNSNCQEGLICDPFDCACQEPASCRGYDNNAQMCILSDTCPNSPGTCGTKENIVIGQCGNDYCNDIYANCDGNCIYNIETNQCELTNQTCDTYETVSHITGFDSFCQTRYEIDGYFWQINTRGASCPAGSYDLFNNWCLVRDTSQDGNNPLSCDICPDNFSCQENNGSGACVVNQLICPTGSTCLENQCILDNDICECCCRTDNYFENRDLAIGDSNPDCCLGTECVPNFCGEGTSDPASEYGLCTGCLRGDSADGISAQEQYDSNQACNCSGISNKYCDLTNLAEFPQGICLSRIPAGESCGQKNSAGICPIDGQCEVGLTCQSNADGCTCQTIDTCRGYALGPMCVTGEFCPNSPGECQPQADVLTGANCGDQQCNDTYPDSCDGNCIYDASLNQCRLDNQLCAESKLACHADNQWKFKPINGFCGEGAAIVDDWCVFATTGENLDCADYKNNRLECGEARFWFSKGDRSDCPEGFLEETIDDDLKCVSQHAWKIEESGSCPNGTFRETDSNWCIFGSIEDDGYHALGCAPQNDQFFQGSLCLIEENICPIGSICQEDRCIVPGFCECCCRVAEADQDCCLGLTCEAELCGAEENYGLCTGCRTELDNNPLTLTRAEQQASDNACLCEGSALKYCSITDASPQGVCLSQKGCGDICARNNECGSRSCQGGICGGEMCNTSGAGDGSGDGAGDGSGDGVGDGSGDGVGDAPKTNGTPGAECVVDENVCSSSEYDSCMADYVCLIPEEGGADCLCCCNPGAINFAGLECKPNQEPCDSNNRGLFCGCVNDNECGPTEAVACGTGACCRARPSVESVTPEENSANICRNTLITIAFDQEMNIDSFQNNVILFGDYDDSPCPEGTEYLTQINKNSKTMNKIASFIPKILNIKTTYADNSNFCSIPGSISGFNDADQEKGVLMFNSSMVFDSNRDYYALIKGDPNMADNSNQGVLNEYGISMNSPDSMTFNGIDYSGKIWKFTTKDEICQVENIELDPQSWLFQRAQDEKIFWAQALSADSQTLNPIPNLYSWNWDWKSDNTRIAQVTTSNNRTQTVISENVKDGKTLVKATAAISADTIMSPITVGREITGEAIVRVFLCENPWPPADDPSAWEPWGDAPSNCPVELLGAACESFNFEFYYCRDAGAAGTSDDLPAINTDQIIRGESETKYCNGGFENDKTCENNAECAGAANSICAFGVCQSGEQIGGQCFEDADCQKAGTCESDLLKEFYFTREKIPDITTLNVTDQGLNSQLGQTVAAQWDKVTGAAGYKLYYGTNSLEYTEIINIAGEDTTTRRLSGLTNNQRYYFALTAYYANGAESVYSPEIEAIPTDRKAPRPPQNLSAEPGDGQATLTWEQGPDEQDEASYKVYLKAGSSCENETPPDCYGLSEETENRAIAFTGLENGVTYYFAVTAIDLYGNESGYSAEASAAPTE